MNRRVKYRFGFQEFSSQKGVSKHAASIRNSYNSGTTVDDPNDVAFLTDLISGHVKSHVKVGIGIARFYVDIAPGRPGTCFWLERLDGSKTDFSVPQCLIGVGGVNRRSLRLAIKPQLDVYREATLAHGAATFISKYSGTVFPANEAVVDHEVPFNDILKLFFEPRGIDIDSELLSQSVDQRSDPSWLNPAIIDEFLDFHRRFPLRLVHWRENASQIKIETNLPISTIKLP